MLCTSLSVFIIRCKIFVRFCTLTCENIFHNSVDCFSILLNYKSLKQKQNPRVHLHPNFTRHRNLIISENLQPNLLPEQLIAGRRCSFNTKKVCIHIVTPRSVSLLIVKQELPVTQGSFWNTKHFVLTFTRSTFRGFL